MIRISGIAFRRRLAAGVAYSGAGLLHLPALYRGPGFFVHAACQRSIAMRLCGPERAVSAGILHS